jgi:GAF domain-containing protein
VSGQKALDFSRLDAPARLAAFEAPLLEAAPDPVLQALVEEASRLTGFPISLVSLVTARIQYWRAHTGLPPELEASRATDRCTSLCQFVVAGDAPLLVEDASAESGLPQDLVGRYGIRAYMGFPLRVLGQTVGSFCVIDVEPRALAPEVREALAALARQASARLEALASQAPVGAGGMAAEPEAQRAWLALAETRPLRSLAERLALGELSLPDFQRALGALAHLSREAA